MSRKLKIIHIEFMIFGVLISIVILLIGIGGLFLLVKRYREALLQNFGQKMAMTAGLLVLFGSFFLLALVQVPKFKSSLTWQDPWLLIRIALGFFILNACLIIACRSLIKSLSNYLK